MPHLEITIPESLIKNFEASVSAKLSSDLTDDVAGQVRDGLTAPGSRFASEVAHIVTRRINRVIDRTVGCDFGGPVF